MKAYVIIGPTASGKSGYALALAGRIGGEIISGDSMQIYRGMDIGTAKPTAEQQKAVPHHLIDIADISESFSAARYVALAREAAEEVASRGKTPVIVGGTGMYIDMLVSGTELPETQTDPEYRRGLYEYAKENGAEALHALLARQDPDAAAAIHPNNVKRVVRALEINRETGLSKSGYEALGANRAPAYESHTVMLMPASRAALYERINARVDEMMSKGLLEEVKALCEKGLRSTPTASQAIGYKEFYPYFDGEITLEQAVENIKRNTRRYAKRQLTWFARMKIDETVGV
ncbi:MAG: tRNA (adenosine(37)-N6)-dimethylallyltransferase MiaA [Clostridia bacterium]|nr:tRNA (adenosine(37)-N6)-dimethylallyltransferase MiaA [Clostridia bacterium]MBR5746702.1 tRNA (adenosine(37)-N6)-dimethylallyltransferase MiaA [Clostridia bacterium]